MLCCAVITGPADSTLTCIIHHVAIPSFVVPFSSPFCFSESDPRVKGKSRYLLIIMTQQLLCKNGPIEHILIRNKYTLLQHRLWLRSHCISFYDKCWLWGKTAGTNGTPHWSRTGIFTSLTYTTCKTDSLLFANPASSTGQQHFIPTHLAIQFKLLLWNNKPLNDKS